MGLPYFQCPPPIFVPTLMMCNILLDAQCPFGFIISDTKKVRVFCTSTVIMFWLYLNMCPLPEFIHIHIIYYGYQLVCNFPHKGHMNFSILSAHFGIHGLPMYMSEPWPQQTVSHNGVFIFACICFCCKKNLFHILFILFCFILYTNFHLLISFFFWISWITLQEFIGEEKVMRLSEL